MGFHNFIINFIVSSNVNTITGLLLTVPLNIYHQIVQETCQSFQMVRFDHEEVDVQDL